MNCSDLNFAVNGWCVWVGGWVNIETHHYQLKYNLMSVSYTLTFSLDILLHILAAHIHI